MKTVSLVVMAAGMGSRYGGIKQLESFGEDGEIIMDYSIFDAVKTGFNKIVIIIRRDFYEDFLEKIGNRLKKSLNLPIHYVFQDINDLPEGFKADGRMKPWGTGQAVLSTRDFINEPFLIINADDFYGFDAFKKMYEYLSTSQEDFGIAGYTLSNTLSKEGGVTRGICKLNKDLELISIEETFDLKKDGEIITGRNYEGKRADFSDETMVSMNMMGFTPKIFDFLEEGFVSFLSSLTKENFEKAEFLIPNLVNEVVSKNLAKVRIVPTSSSWFGVTYKEDKEEFISSLRTLTEAGIYPKSLWR